MAGDFNGDGRTDLLAADQSFRDVATLLGNGDGSFRNVGSNPVGLQPDALVAGDFTGDGRPDLAVANQYTQDVSILQGNGDGSFRNVGSIPAGQTPLALAAGDFNSDGRTDLAVVDYGSNQVTLLLGNGDGTFQDVGSIPTGQAPTAIAAGDFTGDGWTDLAVVDYGSNQVTLLLGNGDGTFRNVGSIPTGQAPYALAAGNFTGDGWTDLAVANYGSNNVTLLLSNGDGTFRNATIPVGEVPTSIVAADFTGDGRIDLTVADEFSNDITLLRGNGDGSFQGLAPIPVEQFPSSIVAGDFNGDGRTDLAAAYAISSDVTILQGAGDGTFQDSKALSLDGLGLMTAMVATDLNGDGRTDLGFALTDPSDVLIRLSSGNDSFVDPGAVALTTRNVPLVADLTGDGVPGVAVVDENGKILVRRGRRDQSGVLNPPLTANPGLPSRDIATVFTNQGLLLASVDAFDDAISLFSFRDTGFVRIASLPTGVQPAQLLSADLDGNGRANLVVRNAGDGTLTLYLGDGNGWFLPRIDLPVVLGASDRTGVSDVTLADLEHNGHLDIIVTDKISGDVRVLRNLRGGSFGPPTIWRGGLASTGWAASRASRASPRWKRPRASSPTCSRRVACRTSWPSTPARTASASWRHSETTAMRTRSRTPRATRPGWSAPPTSAETAWLTWPSSTPRTSWRSIGTRAGTASPARHRSAPATDPPA